MKLLPSWLVCALLLSTSTSLAKEYVVPKGAEVSQFFALLPDDATYVSFSEASQYQSNSDIVLPDRRMLVIDGKGATLLLGPGSNGFTREVADQQEAMQRIGSRYVIKDFAEIREGKKGVDLKATLGSVIENCRFLRQSEAAIDLRFCLMANLKNIQVTNPKGKGIVLRQGDWKGATAFNSQCNSSVLEQCRVNCSKTTTIAFTILNSGGVHMTDCVSEGAPCEYDIFLSATVDGDESKPAKNTVVKSFSLSNFHVEHSPTIASIYVNMPPKASVSLSNVYWNNKQTAPVISYSMGQLNLRDIGWFREEFQIHTRISAPRIKAEDCHSALDLTDKNVRNDKRAGVLYLRNAFPDNTQLKLNYVRMRDPSR